MYIILLLSVSCPVALFLLHCGASVTITNSSYVETYLANKAHSDSDSESMQKILKNRPRLGFYFSLKCAKLLAICVCVAFRVRET